MGSHLIDGEFQSDKYPECPRGKVPLSTKDPAAQDLLWEYAQRRRSGSHGSREVDVEFADDVEASLRLKGYSGPTWTALVKVVKTIEQFRSWATTAARLFAKDGPLSHVNRDFADEIRPFDPALADLYVRAAEVNESIRAHLAKQVEAR